MGYTGYFKQSISTELDYRLTQIGSKLCEILGISTNVSNDDIKKVKDELFFRVIEFDFKNVKASVSRTPDSIDITYIVPVSSGGNSLIYWDSQMHTLKNFPKVSVNGLEEYKVELTVKYLVSNIDGTITSNIDFETHLRTMCEYFFKNIDILNNAISTSNRQIENNINEKLSVFYDENKKIEDLFNHFGVKLGTTKD